MTPGIERSETRNRTAELSASGSEFRADRRRPPYRAFVQLLRRAHLYAGLLMLPWVVLYGATAFLFNHPAVFGDQPTTAFGRDALAGTPMETPPAPAELAALVVAALQTCAAPGTNYSLLDPGQARYTREFAFATVKGEGRETNVLIDVTGSGGTVRTRTVPQAKPEEAAPFAVGGRPAGGPSGRGGGGSRGTARGGEGLKLDDPLHERVAASIPKVLERTGTPAGEIAVTSVPDLSFLMDADGKTWRVTYNPQTGIVSGRPGDEPVAEPPTIRRFLTRLHTTHGYPADVNARWTWAVIVDVMAAIMLFWAFSGILMWWQLKSTRRYGLAVLLVSAAAAAWIGYEMHALMAAAPAR